MKQNEELKLIKMKFRQQERQINQLREKFYQMQEALVSQMLFDSNLKMQKLSPVEVVNKSARKTVIAFGGMLTSLGMPSSEFFGTLIKSSDFNVIFVKDYWQSWYQKGLLGVSEDVLSTSEYLKSILPSTTEDVICLGTSSGGFAAILFSELLEANKSISFSPQVNIDMNTFLNFRTPDSRWDEIKESNFLDLRRRISGKVEHNIYVGQGNLIDMNQVDLLPTLDIIKILCLETDQHNIAGFLKNKMLLSSVLNEHLME